MAQSAELTEMAEFAALGERGVLVRREPLVATALSGLPLGAVAPPSDPPVHGAPARGRRGWPDRSP
ncbi:hypothetical protein ACH4FX_42690 [Streptomyces sp. NPDC018019]|uniref:hypothetical protein n=1 Tax=Streptomyces sp. NPDC018019 TaxID=3365030 RepID=UPI00378C42E0